MPRPSKKIEIRKQVLTLLPRTDLEQLAHQFVTRFEFRSQQKADMVKLLIENWNEDAVLFYVRQLISKAR
jgi:hypothetical protein